MFDFEMELKKLCEQNADELFLDYKNDVTAGFEVF